ncbi:hypothetical protein BC940DRAFT_312299 [Gongronella butleri]|nr:hypothetical protein BC940DRAFT_312299 [Gongronella butleri]
MLLHFPVLLMLATAARAITPTPMARVGCVVLQKTLYCYGGSDTGALNNITTYNTHYSLDLSVNFDTSNFQWQAVPPPSDFALEPNAAFAMVPVNASAYVIIGGAGNNTNPIQLTNLTTLYNAAQNSWQAIPTNLASPVNLNGSFFGKVSGNANFTRLTIVGSMDNSGRLWVWDGSSTIAAGATNARATFDILSTSAYTWSTSAYDMVDQNRWMKRSYMASVISSAGVIYYIGGRDCMYTAIDTMDCTQYAPMDEIFAFDTQATAWKQINVQPGSIPPPRSGHTCIYVNRTNEIISYGGNNVQGGYIQWGYVAILDLSTFSWRSTDISGNNGAGPRSSHIAVNYNDKWMLIGFGSNAKNTPLNDMYFANIENTQNMYWGAQFLTNGTPPGSHGNGPNGSDSSSLSTGAMAGAIVGGVVGALLLGGAGFWIYRQYRRGILFHPGAPPTGFSEPLFPGGEGTNSDHELLPSSDKPDRPPFQTFSQDGSTTLTSQSFNSLAQKPDNAAPTMASMTALALKPVGDAAHDNDHDAEMTDAHGEAAVKPYGVEYQRDHRPMFDPAPQKPSIDHL